MLSQFRLCTEVYMKTDTLKHRIYWWILHVSRNNKFISPFIDICAYYFYKIFRSALTFTFNGKKYHYFYHLYNRTFSGERQIEIPIAIDYINAFKGKEILEIGNVLSHYMPIHHDVLDKYEKGKGVINKDVVSVDFHKKYDLMVSVSTMEHVGHSYGEKSDPTKFLKSIVNLKRQLTNTGKIVITVPVFFNEALTRLIVSRKMPFTHVYFMKRTNYVNDWKQVDYKEAVAGNIYDGHFANTNVLCICVYDKRQV